MASSSHLASASPRTAARSLPALTRVARTRLVLLCALVSSALLWGAAAWMGVVVAVRAVRVARHTAPGGEMAAAAGSWLAFAVAATLALCAMAVVLWRGRHASSTAAVALWVEAQRPALRYALVTAVDARAASLAAAPALESEVARVSWRTPLARASALALARPLAVLAVLAVVGEALPARWARPITRPVASRPSGSVSSVRWASPLARVRVDVAPPAYSRRAPRMLSNPMSVSALAGSRLRVSGTDAERVVRGMLGNVALRSERNAGRWQFGITMPERPSALRLSAGDAERLVVLEPVPDSAPDVSLVLPARDTVLRSPAGRLVIAASARDDIGLAALWIELTVSSGSGENFAFRTAVLARERPGGAREASVRAMLRLDTLRLAPGDLLHVRAVARDGNDITGPGEGASETRVVRIARAGEYDSLAVEAAPPPAVDTAAMSQRMLLLLAERLEARRTRLVRDTLVRESRRLAADQARLRSRVGDIIGQNAGESGAATALGAAARASGDTARAPLLDAYDAMWEAERALQIGEPGRALRPMRLAIAAIQRARAANRRYLRGRPPPVVVDVARVRLTGERDSVSAAPATPHAPLAERARLRARLDAAILLLERNAAAAVDSLRLLRVDALGAEPALASTLGMAVDSLRSRGDAAALIARARRLATGEAPRSRGTLPAWGGAW